jgi:hypothetical protein
MQYNWVTQQANAVERVEYALRGVYEYEGGLKAIYAP